MHVEKSRRLFFFYVIIYSAQTISWKPSVPFPSGAQDFFFSTFEVYGNFNFTIYIYPFVVVQTEWPFAGKNIIFEERIVLLERKKNRRFLQIKMEEIRHFTGVG